jgi:beta-glucosidase
LEKLELYNKTWKYTQRYAFDFDFIGVQNYFCITVKHNSLVPIVNASEVKAVARKVPYTGMGWEINPASFGRMVKRFAQYAPGKDIIVTESGAMFKDELVNGQVDDKARIDYFQKYLHALYDAKQECNNIKGYFAWTLTDNFEWAEGYHARFGLIHVDFKTQLRTIKNSGYWFRDYLTPGPSPQLERGAQIGRTSQFEKEA